MLWAWNMFLAAAPYFQTRFAASPSLLSHFQAAELSVSCTTNLAVMLLLSARQHGASYPSRITSSLLINIVAFTVLALSTLVPMSAESYFGFLLVVILAASLSTGLIQNGLFSFAAASGRAEYTQAIMAGQAVAGVLPPLTQIVSVVVAGKSEKHGKHEKDSVSDDEGGVSGSEVETGADYKSAMIYFLTATVVSLVALLAFIHLLRRRKQAEFLFSAKDSTTASSENDTTPNDHEHLIQHQHQRDTSNIPLAHLFTLLRPYALTIILVFTTTMLIFPVSTTKILSAADPPTPPALFIPLAFLVWNLGDLVGRLLPLLPFCDLTLRPRLLLALAVLRIAWVPLYMLCGARSGSSQKSETWIPSDAFYLLVVQFPFGLSNGYLASSSMVGAAGFFNLTSAEPHHNNGDGDDGNEEGDTRNAKEKENENEKKKQAAGGFMGLMLVAGLTIGSFLSFTLG